MTQDQYTTQIIIKTMNPHILPIAKAMYHEEINLEMGLEFLEQWFNLNDCTTWNDKDTEAVFDESFTFTTQNIISHYMDYVQHIRPDADAYTIQTLRDEVEQLKKDNETLYNELKSIKEDLGIRDK